MFRRKINIKNETSDIKKKLMVSLWVNPFLNAECEDVAMETTAIIIQVYSTIILTCVLMFDIV